MQAGLKNIVLVDDHVIIRNGLKELIEKLGNYTVSHQFDNGRPLIEAWPLSPKPDLIVLDLHMPGMSGEQAVEALKEKQNEIPVLILTLQEDEATIVRLFRSGVRGYLKKNCSSAELKDALEEIFRKGYYHNEFLAYSLQTETIEIKKTEQEQIADQLSAREREFLKLVCDEKEYTYEQMADLMAVHRRTVDGYRESIFQKFNIRSKTGLVLFVLKYRLMDLL
jgi:DNA-binding NarL/FixJ family response regulator